MVMNATTIKVGQTTRNRLKDFGKKGETYDDLINRLLDGINPT